MVTEVTKYDFSSLGMTPEMAVQAEAGGFRVVDQDWLDIVERCLPGLLKPPYFEVLRRVLDPAVETRGRPANGKISRKQLIDCLRERANEHVHQDFLELLIKRVSSRNRYGRIDLNQRNAAIREKHYRDLLLSGLYDDFYDLLTPGAQCVHHEIIGEIEVPSGPQFITRADKASEMTRKYVSAKMKKKAPSARTIANRVTATPGRKRRPRS